MLVPCQVMETLKVLKARGQAEACWKSFKERTLTKRNARENLLLNSDFNALLHSLLYEGNEKAWKIAFEFVIKCVDAKMVSPTALLTLMQQKLPNSNASRIESIPVLERAAFFVLEAEKRTGTDFCFQLASSDLRTNPFIAEKLLAQEELDFTSSFVNYILGDPDVCIIKSIFDNPHYKLSRFRFLSYLATNVEKQEFAELLADYMIWNSCRPCLAEMNNISPMIEFFSQSLTPSTSHVELFEVYVETICNGYMKYGIFSENIEIVCMKCPNIITASIAFRLGSVLALRSSPCSKLVKRVLNVMSKFESLANFAKVICSKLLMQLADENDEEMLILMKFIYSVSYHSVAIELSPDSFNDFGMIIRLRLSGLRPNNALYDNYYDLIQISENLDKLYELNLSEFMKRGHFEALFGLLAYQWTTMNANHEALTKCFLQLLGDVGDEVSEGKVLRYSWVVDFFETNFNEKMYLELLPVICGSVSSTDNILFAFVQQKITHFLAQKENVLVQVPCMISLLTLLESSQSRQSRLNFLTTSALSFLHNITQRNIVEIDCFAVFTCFKLIGGLCDSAVIDPRDIWQKYVVRILDIADLEANGFVRGAISCFCAAVRTIPDGKHPLDIPIFHYCLGPEGELNEVKNAGICFLLEKLAKEVDVFVLEQVCEALSAFNIETIRIVQINMLKPSTDEEEVDAKEVPIEDLLSNSILFNPVLLFEVSKHYKTIGPLYKKLWTKLVDHEVEKMPRTLFLGSSEAATSKREDAGTKYSSNSSFCNGLLFESFDGIDFNNTADVVKCIKSRLIPLITSVNSLLWYVRPHFPQYLLECVQNIFKKIDDQRITKNLSSYEFLLSELRTGNSPQAACNLLMVISAFMKCLFMNQIISENYLFCNWIAVLTKRLGEMSEFKSLMGNDEFLACLAISCNILSGCSVEIDSAMSEMLRSQIMTKVKDGVSVYCAIEALSKSDCRHVQTILSDKTSTSVRKLVGIFALQRLKLPIDKLEVSEKADDIASILEIVALKHTNHILKPIVDPLEFKGLNAYIQSLQSPEELKEKCKQRAFDTGNVPAALKYDSIWGYLLGSNMNMLEMISYGRDLQLLESSTKDSKCLALLQMLSRSSSKVVSTHVAVAGLGRFEKFSWLKYISLTDLKYSVLTNCKLLPRIAWDPVPCSYFDFTLKHVLSITPITNVPYINPSLLSCFLDQVKEFSKTADDEKIAIIIKILNSNSDEKSAELIVDILNDLILQSASSTVKVALTECQKYPSSILKSFELKAFNEMKPEALAEISDTIFEFATYLGRDKSEMLAVGLNDDLFGTLKTILNSNECEKRLHILSLIIKHMNDKQQLKCAIEVIDMIYVHQKDEIKFNMLLLLLEKIFDNFELILLNAKSGLANPEFASKIRSRLSLIPQDICIPLEMGIAAFEFEKESF